MPKHITVGQQCRAAAFWGTIEQEDKLEYFNRSTRPMPTDPHRGLLRVHENIWEGQNTFKKFRAVFIFIRILLNMFIFTRQLHIAFFLGGEESSSAALGEAQVDVHPHEILNSTGFIACGKPVVGNITNCLRTDLQRFLSYQIFSAIEAAVFLILFICVLLCVVAFLCGAKKLPSQSFWFFIFAPRFLAGSSTMSALGFWNAGRFAMLVLNGEFTLWMTMIRFSLPGGHEKLRSRMNDVSETQSEQKRTPLIRHVWHVLLYFAMLGIGWKAFLMKLTSIHFAVVFNAIDWSLPQWLQLLGVLNQAAGVMNLDFIEWNRVLLTVYGGPEVAWTPRCRLAVNSYLHLVADEVVESKIGDDCRVGPCRFGSLIALLTLSSVDMQKLFVSQCREDRISDGQDFRSKTMRDLWLSGGSSYKTDLAALRRKWAEDECSSKQDLEKRLRVLVAIEKDRLATKRAELLQVAVERTLSKDEKQEGGCTAPSSTVFHLVTELQECIEDLDGMQFSDSDGQEESAEEEEEEKEADDADSGRGEYALLPFVSREGSLQE